MRNVTNLCADTSRSKVCFKTDGEALVEILKGVPSHFSELLKVRIKISLFIIEQKWSLI